MYFSCQGVRIVFIEFCQNNYFLISDNEYTIVSNKGLVVIVFIINPLLIVVYANFSVKKR